jgi:hypothetical protein
MSRRDRQQFDRGDARRRWTALPAAAAAVLLGMTLLVAAPASAAPAPSRPQPRDVELSATPTSRLPATGAQITVEGSGYDSGGELWVAVCQDDGAAPSSFAHCLGGAIPSANATTAWAVVTKKGNAPYAGPASAKWGRGGSFTVSLQIPVAVGQDADCVSSPCSVYTRSADDGDRSQDAQVPVRFTFDTSPSTGGTTPSTEVVGAAPTTVAPDSVQAAEAPVGSDQVVVFSGFTPGEVVDSVLYSDPIPLPPVQADPTGTVTLAFVVPEELSPGTHLVQATGRQSARVGVAQFEVVAAEAPTDATTSGATATTETAAPTDTVEPEIVAPPPTTASGNETVATSPTTADAAATTAQSPEAAGAPLTSDSSGASRLLWLWLVLGALIVIGGAAAIVVMLRRRRDDDLGYGDLPPAQPVDEVVEAPSWQAVAESGPAEAWQPGGPAHPVDDQALRGEYPPGDAGPATEQWSPLFGPATDGDDAGPTTEQWSPLFDHAEGSDTARDGGDPARDGGDAGPATEQWKPAFTDDDQPPAAGRHRSE